MYSIAKQNDVEKISFLFLCSPLTNIPDSEANVLVRHSLDVESCEAKDDVRNTAHLISDYGDSYRLWGSW